MNWIDLLVDMQNIVPNDHWPIIVCNLASLEPSYDINNGYSLIAIRS